MARLMKMPASVFRNSCLRMLGLSPQDSAAIALRVAQRIQDYQSASS